MELRNSENLKDNKLSKRVIGATIEVHHSLGPGFLEVFYEEALCIELVARGISFDSQFPVSLFYREREIGIHRLDLLIEGSLVVELKAVKEIDPIHFSVV